MKYIKWLCMTGLLLLTTACEKEVTNRNLKEIQFTASLEPLGSGDPNAKVYLHNEQWIYWELGDQISLGSNKSSGAPEAARLVNSSPGDYEDFNGVFVGSLPENSCYFLGLHPHSGENIITGSGGNFGETNAELFSTIVINLPATQPRRTDSKEDITFAKQVFPMVAWYGGHWDDTPGSTPFNLNFHALAGIVRLELFNATASTAEVTSVTFTAIEDAYNDNAQLCGKFDVEDYNTNFPYLVSKESSAATKTVTLAAPSESFAPNDLKTFYLVLPAMKPDNGTTKYHLRMTVYATVGGDAKEFTKDFKVNIRRNGITNMNALGVTDWNAAPSTYGLAGHGTKERPFKIYTVADLVYLRDCYNDSTLGIPRRINGQPITKDTYISLMRSDIVLTTANWNSGSITDFRGHFNDAEHSPVSPGITNESNIPIFENIVDSGFVTGLTVKTNASTVLIANGDQGVSPFCNVNRGIIKNCRVNGTATATSSDIAGLVAQNLDGGQIIGSACEANLVASGKNAAGICLHNVSSGGHESIISECNIPSMTITATAVNAAGICYDNRGTVKDCYFGATVDEGATSNWGPIVFVNGAAGKVRHCYFNGSIITTGTVAGIVNTMSGAGSEVNYCRLEGPVRGTHAGGVAYSVSNGTLINCYANNATASVKVTTSGGDQYGGGLVATLTGGAVKNSFVRTVTISVEGAAGPYLGGIVGSVSGGTIDNCYAYEGYTHKFYGVKSGTPTLTDFCYLVGYSQTGVNEIDPSAMNALLGYLNAHVPSGGMNWEIITPGDPPTLVFTTL